MEDKFLKHTKIEKLDASGAGMGECEGRMAYVWNALPGEEVEFRVYKKRRGRFEGVSTKILKASPDRVEAREVDHFQSCSPWQVLKEDKEGDYKLELANELYSKAGLQLPGELEIVDSEKRYHYRNKMEYSFTLDEVCDLSYAFFARGRQGMVPIAACHLGSTAINEAAEQILGWLNDNPISDEIIKSLLLRSNLAGEVIGALFLTEHFNLPELPVLGEHLVGFHVYYSRPESPASTADKLIYSEGEKSLVEDLNGVKLRYGALSFFQVNVPVFRAALDDIAPWVKGSSKLIDLYSGTGSISLPLYAEYKECTLVDENRESIDLANKNISANGIENCKAVLERAENMTELIVKGSTVILDPPRPGLHKKVIARLNEVKPKRIIYLSCNIKTQADDVKDLMENYKITYARLYNFFPRTPHTEGLLVLEKK